LFHDTMFLHHRRRRYHHIMFITIIFFVSRYYRSRGLKAKEIIKKIWSAKEPVVVTPNDSCSKMALNLCRAIESRWKRNCPGTDLTGGRRGPWEAGPWRPRASGTPKG